MTRVYIPAIPQQELRARAERIRAIIDRNGIKYFVPRSTNIFNTTFILTREVLEPIPELKRIGDLITYHTFTHHGLFKPTIAEVLAQIPEEIVGHVDAFEIVSQPETIGDLYRDKEAFAAGYHMATTRLYCRV